MDTELSHRMIAACGINCTLCLGFQWKRNKCDGCWAPENRKRHHCAVCRIKNCELLLQTDSKFVTNVLNIRVTG